MLTTLRPGYYLGIDGGATITRAAITKESGFLVGQGEAGPSNLHNDGQDNFSNILEAIDKAKADVKTKFPDLSVDRFVAACLGISGFDTVHDREKFSKIHASLPEDQKTLGASKLIVASNGLVGLMTGAEVPIGVCIRAATGSSCYAINRSGKEVTAGNWGYLLGDQFSAFALGKAMLCQVMKEYDNRAIKTKLTSKVLEFLGLHHPSDLVDWVYNHESSVKAIASLSQLIDDPELYDSAEIFEMLQSILKELILSYQAVVERLKLGNADDFSVVLVGGLFKTKNSFARMVIRSILNITPNATIVSPNISTAEGAAQIARMHRQIKIFPESVLTILNNAYNLEDSARV